MAFQATDLEPKKLIYHDTDYVYEAASWTDPKQSWLNKFDQGVRNGWDTAMAGGFFRYNLDHMKTRIVPGDKQFVLQLNAKRGTERRKPEFIESINQPFDPKKFNFSKVKPGEILHQMCPQDGTEEEISQENGTAGSHVLSNGGCSHLQTEEIIVKKKESVHILLINTAPLEYGHILLVPDVHSAIQQRLTHTGVKMAIELLLLSSHPGWRVGFNGLCAYASVNHQHIHAWYVEYPLFAESAPVVTICEGFYELSADAHVKGFMFQLHGNSLHQLVKKVFATVNYLQESDVAHNVFMTRGSPVAQAKDQAPKNTVRVYVYPRKKVIGCKTEDNVSVFNTAVAELGGEVPMYAPQYYDSLTQEDIISSIQSHMLPQSEFDNIRQQLSKILSQIC